MGHHRSVVQSQVGCTAGWGVCACVYDGVGGWLVLWGLLRAQIDSYRHWLFYLYPHPSLGRCNRESVCSHCELGPAAWS